MFTVHFPPSANSQERVHEEPTIARQTGVVLVVDDESAVRMTAKLALERRGFTVLLAENGLECIQLVRKDPDRFDVILLDVAMPVMDGEEAFKRLIEIRPDIWVLCFLQWLR